jgi:hypothetical protein
MTRMREVLAQFFFAEQSRTNLVALRIVASLSALWIVLSRPVLPEILAWPAGIWSTVIPATRFRFLLAFPQPVEWALWAILPVLLLLTAAGVLTRWFALGSALLLYHFAPVESIFNGANPYLRGLTITTLALVIVSAASSPTADEGPSWRNRWPVALVQLLFVTMYFFAGWAKVVTSGFDWVSAANISRVVLGLDQMLDYPGATHGALIVAHTPVLASALGIFGVTFELLFPIAIVSPRARSGFAVAALSFHVINYFALHIHFPEMAMLLVFVNWQAVSGTRTMRRPWQTS